MLKARDRNRGQRWMRVVYVLCFLGLIGVSGAGWREWRAGQRGIERSRDQWDEWESGVNVALEQYETGQRQRVLDDVVYLGFRWVRQRLPWRAIEPQPGAYHWEPWDAIVAAVSERDLGLVIVLDDPPAWALRNDPYPLPCVPPCHREAYGRFVGAVAGRYGTVVDYYQVWDEPNLSRAWGGGHVAPCGYATLLETAYPVIHDVDPVAYVLGGGLAPTQAPGPDNLNDLTYLRQLYAMGGGAYFDILAVKGYGFWTGPADRRVESDVLNFSRAIAAREIMGDFGDRDKPVWAVEWGWHVSPASEANRPISWGTDRAFVQGERIVGAVDRAGVEWPWMTVMCWAEYQPQTAADDPRWGFALRDIQGEPTALYDVLRIANEPGQDTHSQGIYTPRARWVVLWAAIGVGWAVWGFLAVQQAFSSGTSLPLEQALPLAAGFFTLLWREWCRQPAWLHGMVVVILGALVALTPWPEWVLFELALAVAVFWLHPRWPVILAVGFIPFFYATKPLGDLDLSASELLMYLAVTSAVAQRLWRAGSLRVQYNWHVLDVVWILWMLWGAGSASSGPNSRLAWREWRLCFLGPWLLYLWLRLAGKGWLDRGVYLGLIGAWLGSAAIVTGVGVVQGLTGAWVPAGSVGRVTGVYYSPNHLALYLERVWPLTLVAAIGLGSRKSWRRVAVGLAFVMGAILFLTYSRGAWLLGVPTALLVVGWAYRGRLRWWMAAGMALGVVLMASNVLLGRMATSAGLLDIRVPVWVSTWRMILDHPWMGVGLAGFRFVYPRYMYLSAWSEPVLYHPHNMWLDAAVRSGLPGMVFFGALVCLSTVSLARWARATGGIAQVLAVGCLAGCLAGVAHGMVDSGYFVGDLAWILALTGGLAQRWLDRCCPAIDMI